MSKKKKDKSHEPTIENRRARFDYTIEETLEVGIVLAGTEVKSVRDGNVSLNEGYVAIEGSPAQMNLLNVTIGEYFPAGQMQHKLTRMRRLLAHRKEITRLQRKLDQKGYTLVPLKLYFKDGYAKLLIGLGTGRQVHDKRHAIRDRESQRELQRAMSKRV